jgi:LPS-assembly protein
MDDLGLLRSSRKLIVFFVLALLIPANKLQGASSLTVNPNEPVLLHADEIQTIHERGIIVARGNVKVYHEGSILTADTLTFNQEYNQITATGNVRLTTPDNQISFANYMELTADLKNALAKDLRMITSDDGKLAAATSHRDEKDDLLMDRAVYSPCKICRSPSTSAPLWQLKSRTVVWDEEAHDIIHTDTVMEFGGIPAFYFPYLRHPDPTVKQRSGLLAPTYGISEDHGFLFMPRYYYVFSPDKDIILAPVITAKGGQFLATTYRQHLGSGTLRLGGSIGESKVLRKTNTPVTSGNEGPEDRKIVQWHLDNHLDYDISRHWKANADIVRVGQPTYFRKYPVFGHTDDSILTSQAQTEGFYGRNYFHLQGISFQGLRQTDFQSKTPLILPLLEFDYLSRPNDWGYHVFFNTNGVAIHRKVGQDTSRLTGTAGIERPFYSPWGDVTTITGSVRGDLYHTNNFFPPGANSEVHDYRGRVIPVGSVDWRYPFVNTFQSGYFLIQPMSKLVITGHGSDQSRFPNEDSLIMEPRDYSLFNDSRFLGYDRVDDVSRVDYGLQFETAQYKKWMFRVFMGQTYSLSDPDPAFVGSGFESRTSDLLGRTEAKFLDVFSLSYRTRLNRRDFSPRRHDLQATLGKPFLKAAVAYHKTPPEITEPSGAGSHQISLTLTSQFTDNWTVGVGTLRALHNGDRGTPGFNKGGTLSQQFMLQYNDECFTLHTTLSRTFYRDRDFKPDRSIMLQLVFKTLGEIRHTYDFVTQENNNNNNVIQ